MSEAPPDNRKLPWRHAIESRGAIAADALPHLSRTATTFEEMQVLDLRRDDEEIALSPGQVNGSVI